MSDASGYLPLSVPVISGNEWEYVRDCLDTGWVSSAGRYVERFEDEIRRITGAQHAVACQSGTAALHVSLLLHGVGTGDAVICPALTFIATVNAIAYTGARPVFVDCDEFMNVDPAVVAEYLRDGCERTAQGVLVDRQTGLRVKAIVPVHVFGNPCDMAAIRALADAYGLAVVEDAAESLGSRWTAGELAGRHTGTIGSLGAFSFNGNKIATAGGGGCIVTDDERLAERARHLTTTAKTDPVHFVHDEVGFNYRLTNLAAALGLAQVERLDEFIATKRENHARYAAGLAGLSGVTVLGVPEGTAPNYWFYSVMIEPGVAGADVETLLARLEADGIQTRPVWHLNHLQAPYREDRAYRTAKAEWFAGRVLNVPCSSDLTAAHVDRVVDAIARACTRGTA